MKIIEDIADLRLPDQVGLLTVVVDTSGGMLPQVLTGVLLTLADEFLAVADGGSTGQVIQFDTTITEVETFNRSNAKRVLVDGFRPHGGGGTSLLPVLDALHGVRQRIVSEKCFSRIQPRRREPNSPVIIISDGMFYDISPDDHRLDDFILFKV